MDRKIWIVAGAAVVLTAGIASRVHREPPENGGGRVTLKSSEGSFSLNPSSDLAKMPVWIPAYAARPDGIFRSDSREESRYSYSFKTADAPSKIAAFFEDRLKVNGFAIHPMINDEGGILNALTADKKRLVTVTIVRGKNATQASVLAIEKK